MDPTEIIAIRQSLDMTQSELADYMEVDFGTVSRWERGIQPVPGPARVLYRLLRDYDFSK